MLTVGNKLPSFRLRAAVSLEAGKQFQDVQHDSYAGKWLVLFAWPLDFTFVCPTEIAEFGKRNGDFQDRDAQVLGLSCDSEFVHLAWRTHHPDLKNLPFPMLADTKRELCQALGILHPQDGLMEAEDSDTENGDSGSGADTVFDPAVTSLDTADEEMICRRLEASPLLLIPT